MFYYSVLLFSLAIWSFYNRRGRPNHLQQAAVPSASITREAARSPSAELAETMPLAVAIDEDPGEQHDLARKYSTREQCSLHSPRPNIHFSHSDSD